MFEYHRGNISHRFKGQHERSAKIDENKYHKISHKIYIYTHKISQNIFLWYFMTRRHEKYNINVSLLITPGFVEKTTKVT